MEELDDRLASIRLTRPTLIQLQSELDVRVIFDDGTRIDFLGSFSESDEHIFHVFGPDQLYVQYSVATGWEVGSSTETLG